MKNKIFILVLCVFGNPAFAQTIESFSVKTATVFLKVDCLKQIASPASMIELNLHPIEPVQVFYYYNAKNNISFTVDSKSNVTLTKKKGTFDLGGKNSSILIGKVDYKETCPYQNQAPGEMNATVKISANVKGTVSSAYTGKCSSRSNFPSSGRSFFRPIVMKSILLDLKTREQIVIEQKGEDEIAVEEDCP